MNKTSPAEQTKQQQDSDNAVVKELSREVDGRCERTKHVLQALQAAAVPLDCVTAEVLTELGTNMHCLIHAAHSED
jgi:hypothetical protein